MNMKNEAIEIQNNILWDSCNSNSAIIIANAIIYSQKKSNAEKLAEAKEYLATQRKSLYYVPFEKSHPKGIFMVGVREVKGSR